MAKRQHLKTTLQQQLLIRFSTICVITLFLVRLDSGSGSAGGGVDALSITLNENGNRLQQPPQQQQTDDSQQQVQQQHAIQHLNNEEEDQEVVHNYIMQKPTTELVTNDANGLMQDDDDEIVLKGNVISGELARSQLNLGNPFKSLNMIKRAPTGFVGMRGKKEAYGDLVATESDDDFVDLNDDDNIEGYEGLAFPWQLLPNNHDDLINWDDYAKPNVRRYKKAPSAFYGVRGKKFTLGNGINPGGDTYRWNQFLEKLDEDRMRDMVIENFMDSLLETTNDDGIQGEMTKRAPTGFTGVRGKRGLGKAFVGVRGKKDVTHEAYKRSPLGGSESSAMGGPGGKRQRFADFGNKFVAVRGKKDSYDEQLQQQLMANDWDSYYNSNHRTGSSRNNNRWSPASSSVSGTGTSMRLLYANGGKRAPTGFVGMRGKRPLISDDLLTIN